jgi:phosphohistidine phosphatase
LLRHAKSSWDDPDLDDADRPLADRGRRAAELIGDHMRADAIAPELVLCSPAVRARQTLVGLGDAVGSASIEIERALYEAHEADLLSRVRKVDGGVGSVMLVGHNPSIERFALLVAAESDLVDDVRAKYPTGALATLQFDGGGWADLGPGKAELAAFVKPRDLDR